MSKIPLKFSHPSWLRRRELRQRFPLGYRDVFFKGLYSSIMPCYSWSHGENIRNPIHGGISSLDFSSDGSLLVAGCERNSIMLFDPLSRRLIYAAHNEHRSCVNNVKFINSWLFASGSDDATIALWDTRNLRARIRTLRGHSNPVRNIEFSSKNDLLVTAGLEGCIFTWDIRNYAEEEIIGREVFNSFDLMRMRLNSDATKMVVSTARGYLMIVHNLDLKTLPQDLDAFEPDMYRFTYLRQATPSPSGNFINLFSQQRKKNRVELITDFPEGDDSNVISALDIHPYGLCAVSRSTCEVKGMEWTCVHDIQEHDVTAGGADASCGSGSDGSLSPTRATSVIFSDGIHQGTERVVCSPEEESSGIPTINSTSAPKGENPEKEREATPRGRKRDGLEEKEEEEERESTGEVENKKDCIGHKSTTISVHFAEHSEDENEERNWKSSKSTSRNIGSEFEDWMTAANSALSSKNSAVESALKNAESAFGGGSSQGLAPQGILEGATAQVPSSPPATGDGREDAEGLAIADFAGHSPVSKAHSTPGSDRLGPGVPCVATSPAHSEIPSEASSPAHSEIPSEASSPAHSGIPSGTTSPAHSGIPTAGTSPAHSRIRSAATSPTHLGIPSAATSPAHLGIPSAAASPAHLGIPSAAASPVHIGIPSAAASPAHLGIPSAATSPGHSGTLFSVTHPPYSGTPSAANSTDHSDTLFATTSPAHSESASAPTSSFHTGTPSAATSPSHLVTLFSVPHPARSGTTSADTSPCHLGIPLATTSQCHSGTHFAVTSPAHSGISSAISPVHSGTHSVATSPVHAGTPSAVISPALLVNPSANTSPILSFKPFADTSLALSMTPSAATSPERSGTPLVPSSPLWTESPTRNSGISMYQGVSSEDLSRPGSSRFDLYSSAPKKSRRVYKYIPRLTHYIQEPNAGRWYINELCFSYDGRLICSPFGQGVRLLAFSPECCEPSGSFLGRDAAVLYEISSYICHDNIVLCTKFSPRHYLLVSGCLGGNLHWHQPVV